MKPLQLFRDWIRYQILKFTLKRRHPVVNDLFENDHDLCLCCGEIFFRSNKKHKYCSKVCNRRHYYIINKK